MGKESHTSPRNPESPKQDTPKAKHPKTHINQINKDQKQAARERQITHKGIPIMITANLSIETLQARREWQDILKVMKENNLQPRLLSQQGSHSDMKENSKALQKAKAERIQHHQTSS